MKTPTLMMRDVHVEFPTQQGSLPVLRGIDFEVFAGEKVGIVGSSGAGKTTFMMVASGLERPSRGRVEIKGQEITALDERGITRLRADVVGIVFQSFHLISSMTALENVMIPLEFAGVPHAKERGSDVLAEVGLSHRLDHYPTQLSGGEQQRVALARAIVRAPKLLLADEPTGNLDEENSQVIIDMLFRLAEQNETSLLLITHDRAIAERCDRQMLMRDGVFFLDEASSASAVRSASGFS